eukprot:364927-Chlamydomonas_euryale.AAC.15
MARGAKICSTDHISGRLAGGATLERHPQRRPSCSQCGAERGPTGRDFRTPCRAASSSLPASRRHSGASGGPPRCWPLRTPDGPAVAPTVGSLCGRRVWKRAFRRVGFVCSAVCHDGKQTRPQQLHAAPRPAKHKSAQQPCDDLQQQTVYLSDARACRKPSRVGAPRASFTKLAPLQAWPMRALRAASSPTMAAAQAPGLTRASCQ